MLYLQKYLRNFQKLSFGWKWWRWLFWLKISCAQTFCFCNSNVTTFPTTRKCKNFNFSLYTIPAEMLYLQKYLTNFQKLSFGWKMRKLALVVENCKCADILVSATFPTTTKCRNFQFFPLHYPSRNAISYLTNFQKPFFWLKDDEGGYSAWKFQSARRFAFAIATLPLFQHPEM